MKRIGGIQMAFHVGEEVQIKQAGPFNGIVGIVQIIIRKRGVKNRYGIHFDDNRFHVFEEKTLTAIKG